MLDGLVELVKCAAGIRAVAPADRVVVVTGERAEVKAQKVPIEVLVREG